MGFWKPVWVFEKSLLKSAFMLKISVLSSSSKAQEQSFYFLKLPLFKLKLMINPSSSKTRSWVSHLWLLAIEKLNFMNAAKLVSALSFPIMGFSRRECIQSPASVLVNNFKLMSRHSARCDDINGTFTACGGDVTFWKVTTILPWLLLYIASDTVSKKT